MKVLIVYFSATGNTAKMAAVIKEKLTELGAEVKEKNITSYSDRLQKIDLKPYQAIIFGLPVHSRRAPKIIREWLTTLDGQGKKCAMFFTFGGFGIHPTHYSTKQILEKQNFVVVSSAEFLGAHTFNISGWKAVPNRPDSSDYDMAREYAVKTYKRFTGEDSGRLGELPKTEHTEEQLDASESLRFKVITQLPTRNGKECSMCMICEEICPTGAMKAETGEAEKGKCIACLGCVANCPDQVLKINDTSKSWLNKLEKEKSSEETIASQKSKIYL